jgi:hypothetical protein
MTYQNYSHYKLPITMDPLKYGDVIAQFDNNYVIQLTTGNILIIQSNDQDNFIKFYRKGEIIFEYKDHKIDDSTFSRIINNSKFTFVNGILVRSDILCNKTFTPLKFTESSIAISKKYTNIIPNTTLANLLKCIPKR